MTYFKFLKPLFFIVCICISNYLYSQNFERIENVADLGFLKKNSGVAVADFDNDGDLDMFVVAKAKDEEGVEESHSKLLKNNNNGTFTDVTSGSGLINLLDSTIDSEKYDGLNGFKHGVSWGDYDNDGYPDLFFTHSYKVQLFHNQGDGTFVDVTASAGIKEVNYCRNTTSTWFDVNNDGFLDVYISEWGECDNNYFYLNNGNGTFKDVTEDFGIKNVKFSYMALPFDFNNDGWMDLYVSNDFERNSLFINENGTGFKEEASNYGLDSGINDMGIAIGDYNKDGFFDLFITAINENVLLTNNGDNTFSNNTDEKNVNDTGWSWGTTFADFDLDGDEDLFVANGYQLADRPNQNQYPSLQNNVYFKNLYVEGDATFSNQEGISNLDETTISVSSMPFDYDNDGDLDLYVTNSDRVSYFYENKTINNNQPVDKNWFKVSLEGTTSNRDAIGTTLILKTNKETLKRYYTGVSLLSQSLQAVHFGLGDATEIIELEINWPSGIKETFNALEVNKLIKVKEGEGFEVEEEEEVIKLEGCTDPNSCNYNPDAVVDNGSCTYLESKSIQGSITSGYFKTEEYSYPNTAGSTYKWHVEGGVLLEGQGTNSIKIKWELDKKGYISVIETSSSCSSELVELEVELKASNLPDKNSIARIWNEALLTAIRGDYARPTVHARNLFHTSIAMYDAWAIYSEEARTYLIGNEVHNFNSSFNGFSTEEPIEEARNKTISYAVYRLLNHRFKNAPKFQNSKEIFDLIMEEYGYDISFVSTDYSKGNSAALGNFIAETIINYGFTDNSRERFTYQNAFYKPVNEALAPKIPGNKNVTDPNRWQPLSLDQFIDQSGNLIEGTTPDFLSPEWGAVSPFSLTSEEKSIFTRNGNEYSVYHYIDGPPQLDLLQDTKLSNAYKWGFNLVSIWGAHLDPTDGVMWDISPKSIGNIDSNDFPESYDNYNNFYNETIGGDIGTGYSINPITNTPYKEQQVPRGDYARVLAEFWADGPDSETPPGHWFTLLNYVNDHELIVKKLNGKGEVLGALEWDVKSYFLMGGTMHDAAITAWGIKGWYDFIRPISAIRYMAELGQSTDASKENYHIAGIPLKEGFVEVVEENDPLAGKEGEHIGKIKVYSWRGHDFIENPVEDTAGVGWILAEYWWPYQRPSFVTPPFAGFVSGHSTYSRAAAEVMTLLTGSEYFPGGMGEFLAKKDEFLVFEKGPSVDVKLQWATYRDASDQCSLSRIWGGIHPPADDIPGRKVGEILGVNAFDYGIQYFSGKELQQSVENSTISFVYPNPTQTDNVYINNTKASDVFWLGDMKGTSIPIKTVHNTSTNITELKSQINLSTGVYILKINNETKMLVKQ
ncbi:Por secretion system C-terminal sorting domain-containing protein [Lutibacter oricola]|uniref:Por secretion system C-terminal sorting domain-containing protein n=1 Tax=Lutibacter oricola TaxID=762486 RepID=A0A1H2XVA5_9FLAO|nr:FG-GAP-like repeat-containing protein [Lutibacter oricola]SDW96843.1 Por secretion system C-terminal sorting domain-containing protein [Lutibacter oricola]